MKNILFYSPYMGFTGAEMMIKNIVSYSKHINPVILSGQKGALLSEISKNIPIFIYPYSSKWKYRYGKLAEKITLPNRYGKLAEKIALPNLSEMQFKNILKKHHIDLVVVNTILAHKIIPFLKKYSVPFVLYAHELPPMFELISKEDMDFLVNNSRGVIGCSKQVCINFKQMGVKNIHLFYEAIDINTIKPSSEIETKIRTKNFSYIFAMSGQRAFHKGYHLIVELALFLKKYNAAIAWLGASNESGISYFIEKTLDAFSIDNVILPGFLKKEPYYSWLNACDAFLLTSLFDSYPLVMIEAAYLQKPIIAFDSGGVSEFVKDGMGKIVPYYHVDAYKEAIKNYIEDKMIINKELLRHEAEQHDISKRVYEFENILFQLLS